MTNIAIFGSGSGTNAENIIKYYQNSQEVQIILLVTNTSKSRFKIIAENSSIPFKLFSNADFNSNTKDVLSFLRDNKVNWIVLAGFLRKIDTALLKAYKNRIINVHPSLLPKHGGAGMYGMKVHQAVLDNKEVESGITVHLVNENFDEGEIIQQKKVDVSNCKSADEIRQKVQELEQLYFPEIINSVL